MRIVVEPSEYYLEDNVGHVAMTHVAVTRITALWPSASIEILAEPSRPVSEFCAGAIPVMKRKLRPGAVESVLDAGLSRLSASASQSMVNLKDGLRRRSPSLFRSLKWLKGRAEAPRPGYSADERHAIANADLMVVSGMGGITDTFAEFAFGLLDRVELALEAGVPVAMMGQGIGPLRDAHLRARAAAILSRVDPVCLREGRTSPSILASLGVRADRIVVTGDDAVEMAFSRRPEMPGSGLGVNLRTASYSSVDLQIASRLASIIRESTAVGAAALVPLPIDKQDIDPIKVLISGCGRADEVARTGSPLEVIEAVKRCRAIITGSYHAAVFALSMGIPAVCIAASDYYVDKFLGLRGEFGTGCEVVMLDRGDWPGKLSAALDYAWPSADQMRPGLLASAQRQVDAGRAAYRMMRDVVVQRTPRIHGGAAAEQGSKGPPP